MNKVIINGELCDAAMAQVSLHNKEIQLGLTVFETMLADNGKIDGLDLHIQRLKNGMLLLGLQMPDFDLLEKNVREVLNANGLLNKRARVRITALLDLIWIEANEAAVRGEVCSVALSDYVLNERSAISGIKCGSYAQNILALRVAQAAGFDEVIFLNTIGEVAEAATANVFIVKDGVIFTPSLDSGCLPGVTRALLIQRARKAGFEVREEKINAEALLEVDEMFLTNTQIGVQGVLRLGDLIIGDSMGEITQRVRQAYLR